MYAINEFFKLVLRRNKASQHCCDIVSNGYNIVTALQQCVALKIVVANRTRVTSPLGLISKITQLATKALLTPTKHA